MLKPLNGLGGRTDQINSAIRLFLNGRVKLKIFLQEAASDKEVASLSSLVEIARGSEAGPGFRAEGPVERSASSEVYAPHFVVEGDGFFVEWQMEDAALQVKAS